MINEYRMFTSRCLNYKTPTEIDGAFVVATMATAREREPHSEKNCTNKLITAYIKWSVFGTATFSLKYIENNTANNTIWSQFFECMTSRATYLEFTPTSAMKSWCTRDPRTGSANPSWKVIYVPLSMPIYFLIFFFLKICKKMFLVRFWCALQSDFSSNFNSKLRKMLETWYFSTISPKTRNKILF